MFKDPALKRKAKADIKSKFEERYDQATSFYFLNYVLFEKNFKQQLKKIQIRQKQMVLHKIAILNFFIFLKSSI